MKSISEIVAGNIKARMKELGLNQKALADRLGYKQPMVSKWLSGDVVPEKHNQELLCKALECSIERLVAADKPDIVRDTLNEMNQRLAKIEDMITKKSQSSSEKNDLLALIDGLNESQVSLALTALDSISRGSFTGSRTRTR